MWTDLFHPGITDEQRGVAYMTFYACPQHVFVVLTKRPKEMARYMAGLKVLPNVAHGTTVELQKHEDRIGHLLNTPSAARFVSQEPGLGMVDFSWYLQKRVPFKKQTGDPNWHDLDIEYKQPLDLIIMGGESGPGARPMHPDWARSTRDQCAAAGVKFHFKQWGAWLPGSQFVKGITDNYSDSRGSGWDYFADHSPTYCIGKKAAGRLLDGVVHDGRETT